MQAKRMPVIDVTNRKGGVGKSTISAHVAAGLAIKGWKVLFVDTDPQGHATHLFGMEEDDGLYKLLVEEKDLSDVLKPVPRESYCREKPKGRLVLLPSSERTGTLSSLVSDPFLFGDRLNEASAVFDVVIMDSYPTTGMFDSSIYLAATDFIYVTQCEALSFDGINKGLAQINRINRKRIENGLLTNHVMGIVPNLVRQNTVSHRTNLETLKETFGGLVWSPVSVQTKFSEASSLGQMIYVYAPSSNAADDMWLIVDRVEAALWQIEARP